jgi:S1-C subfamily serine protease
MIHSLSIFRFGALIAGLACVAVESPSQTATRTNGLFLTESLGGLRATALGIRAQVLDADGEPRMAATLLSRDGYFLTKASETPALSEASLLLTNGHQGSVREVWRDKARDLVLGQVPGLGTRKALVMNPGANLRHGTWLCALHGDQGEIRLGVSSANRRRIPSMGAALGIRMGPQQEEPQQADGVRIVGVASDSPAEAAGLKRNDILLEIEGERVQQFANVRDIVSRRQPGDELLVRFRRNGRDSQVSVRLASRTKVLANWDGEDYANGGISLRTDGFPDIIQHDLPLNPPDMGGPLLDLQGNLVAINISRVDRVTTFALPLESFWEEVREKIVADRKKTSSAD